jgi:hypothetical protein
MSVLREYADESYALLDVNLSPAKAIDDLGPAHYVFAERSRVGLVGAGSREDLGRCAQGGDVDLSGLPPAVVVPADWTFAHLVESDAVTLLDLGGVGVVLVHDEKPVGLVPLAEIRRHRDVERLLLTRILGDSDAAADGVLAGDYQTAFGRVLCRSLNCGFPNTVGFFDRFRPPRCANPDLPEHPLTITR